MLEKKTLTTDADDDLFDWLFDETEFGWGCELCIGGPPCCWGWPTCPSEGPIGTIFRARLI